eukprot:scpid75678/ scgid29653/ 
MDNLRKHFEQHGIEPRTHGNTHRRPHNALHFADVKRCVEFISAFVQDFGIPHPAPLRGRADTPPVFLPAYLTYKAVHAKYLAMCESGGYKTNLMSSMRAIWHQCLPSIKFMTPRTDVCSTCEALRQKVTTAFGEIEKLQASKDLADQVNTAQREREHYKQATLDAKAELGSGVAIKRKVHYMFDFAQNVFLPNT